MKEGECCPEFNPAKYDKKKVTWKGKLFIKDRYFSLFHIPLNLGSVMRKNIKKLEDANAMLKEPMVLIDEKSAFGSNIYISTKRAIPKAHDVKLTGTFLTRVFEGPYKDMKKYIKDMKEYVILEKQELKHLYFYYPYCPECAKKYGHNYVVIFAEI